MYRVIKMGSKLFAVELGTSGRDMQDEMDEIEQLMEEGSIEEAKIVLDYEELGAELITRDYL